jgi:hypothetical protein
MGDGSAGRENANTCRFHLESEAHLADRKVIEQRQSRAVADKLANIDLKMGHAGSRKLQLKF